jgi:hypothetical protein
VTHQACNREASRTISTRTTSPSSLPRLIFLGTASSQPALEAFQQLPTGRPGRTVHRGRRPGRARRRPAHERGPSDPPPRFPAPSGRRHPRRYRPDLPTSPPSDDPPPPSSGAAVPADDAGVPLAPRESSTVPAATRLMPVDARPCPRCEKPFSSLPFPPHRAADETGEGDRHHSCQPVPRSLRGQGVRGSSHRRSRAVIGVPEREGSTVTGRPRIGQETPGPPTQRRRGGPTP